MDLEAAMNTRATANSVLAPDAGMSAAEFIDPRTPRRPLALPDSERTYAFSLDNDLIKLVTLTPGRGELAIRVRYATDAVLQEDRHVIAMPGTAEITADGLGLVVTWHAPLLPGLNWPVTRRTRRF